MHEPSKAPENPVALILTKAAHGGVIGNADLARRMAELLVADHYGATSLDRQRPLRVHDCGDSWRVEGSAKPGRDGEGAFFLSLRKFDAQVVDIGRRCALAAAADSAKPQRRP